MQRIVRTHTTQRVQQPGSGRVRMTAADRARERGVHGARRALDATSVVLVGPEQWRVAVERITVENQRLAIAADVDGNPRQVDIYSLPQADVVLIAVDAAEPNQAIEFALRLQAKDRGTAIALVLPKMSSRNLRYFYQYAGSWSLISGSACGDADRLGAVLESAGRGIPWVDPIVARILKALDANGLNTPDDEMDDEVMKLLSHPSEHDPDSKAAA